jgi:hypothetical protein
MIGITDGVTLSLIVSPGNLRQMSDRLQQICGPATVMMRHEGQLSSARESSSFGLGDLPERGH